MSSIGPFDSVPVSDAGLERIEVIRAAATALHNAMYPGNADGRCMSVAKTHLETAVMWANKGVSRGG